MDKDKMLDWICAPTDVSKYQGYVYIITNKITDKYYIGKKFFHSKRVRKPLKGKKNKRHYVVESDWKTYYGSSNNLLADIELYGVQNFERRILMLCLDKFDCAYYELKEQMDRNVLFDNKSYNEIINVRLRKRKV